MSNNDTQKITNQFSAEEIEKELDHLEEEEKADFNQWFNSYVNDEPKSDESKVDNEQKVDEVVNESQEVNNETQEADNEEVNNESQEVEESVESKTDETQEVEPKADDEQKVDEVVNESQEAEEVKNENDESKNEVNNDESKTDDESQTFSLSDIQQKQNHKTVKTNVEVKHRKHRSRKTELSASKPPKEPVVLQESENAKVEIGTEKAEKLSDEELEKKIKKAANKLTNDIKDQVKTMEQNGNCRKIDPLEYTIGTEKYNIFKHYLFDMLLVPKRCITRFNLNEYISSVTIFNYNCFDSPNVAMQHPIPEKVIFTEKLNSLFGYQFANSKSGDFHFADLDIQLLKFINLHADKSTLAFEYKLIRSALGKLILCLNTDVELALRDNTRPTINSAFKQAVIKDIQHMKYIQSSNGKTFASWKAFLDTFLSVGSDKLIYVHDNYRNLNTKLELAYSNDFLVENLLGNTLKCYLPSVALNYFYAIKSIYVIARLVSLYVQLRLFKDKSAEDVMNDLFTIAVCGTVIYENKSFIFKQATRSLPGYDKPLSNETKLYILNHLLTGGQYYIVKMIEEALPVIATDLIKSN